MGSIPSISVAMPDLSGQLNLPVNHQSNLIYAFLGIIIFSIFTNETTNT